MENSEVNLYYSEPFEDRWVPGDRYLRKIIRRIVRGRQQTGHRRLVDNLIRGLQSIDVEYRMNDFQSFKNSPLKTIGLLGKKYALDAWNVPNVILCGPAMFDHPKDCPELFDVYNVSYYLVPSQWVKRMYEPYWGERVVVWPVGIDTEFWADFSNVDKRVDFLIYEKFLWDRDANYTNTLGPILEELNRRRLTWDIIHCGSYSEGEYLCKLRSARYMIFLCEHETQGLAYQEALSCNVPILAWDKGVWLDPKAKFYEKKPIEATSVPYFSEECGMTFSDVDSFSYRLDAFLSKNYDPRNYVLDNLDLRRCAERYCQLITLSENMV